MRKLVFLMLLFLTGCVSNVSHETKLQPNQGILVTDILCGKQTSSVGIYKTGVKSKAGIINFGGFTRETALLCGKESVKIISLMEGDYYLGDISDASTAAISEKDAYKFSIEKDKLNYIGDVTVNSSAKSIWSSGTIYVSVNIADNSKQMMKVLTEQYPELSSKYEYRVDIAKKQ